MKEIYCNMCGVEIEPSKGDDWCEIKATIGYGSKYDGMEMELDLCCECLDKLIDSCEIFPMMENRSI